MDRAFLSYYEEELGHIRGLAGEFGAMHPTAARNLSLDSVPCPDPYVERLLEGVAFLAARTRLKLDLEAGRHVQAVLDALYPDLVGPAPAVSVARLAPGPQVGTMRDGHLVRRGTRLVAGLREGLATRAIYTTAQDVTLWPIQVEVAEYLQDVSALRAASLSDRAIAGSEAGLRIAIARTAPGGLADLSLDRLDLFLGGRSRGGALLDAILGYGRRALARPIGSREAFASVGAPAMAGIRAEEALLPRTRPSFEGHRLLREYFLMPERFHYLRFDGLREVVGACRDGGLEIVLPLERARPDLRGVAAADLVLFATPVANLFERECDVVEVDPRRSRHVVHADRARARDHEIHRVLRVEDADREGPEASVSPLYEPAPRRGSGWVFAAERRPRRPGEDERRRGQTRTSYAGDDVFVSIAPGGASPAPAPRRLHVRALCSNRDLPVLDDTPALGLDSGDPVAEVRLLFAMRPPREALHAAAPSAAGGDASDALAWRLVAQLSLDHLSLAGEGQDAEPLRALLRLYADRGDPALEGHAKSVVRLGSEPVVERLGLPGPICFGHGTAVTLEVDDAVLSGASTLLLSALLSRLLARHAAVNAFVRTRTRLARRQETIEWPTTPGLRPLV